MSLTLRFIICRMISHNEHLPTALPGACPVMRVRYSSCSILSTQGLEVAFLHLLGQIIGGAVGERQDRQRRVLLGRRREGAAVNDKEILDRVHLIELIQRRTLRVVAHATGAVLVNGRAVRARVLAVK